MNKQNQYQNQPKPEILIVYNTNSASLSRFLGKIMSKDKLYRLVYGYFGKRAVWKDFEAEKSVKIKFLHKDQFKNQITALDIEFPIIFSREKGKLRTFLTAKKLGKLKSTEELIQILHKLRHL